MTLVVAVGKMFNDDWMRERGFRRPQKQRIIKDHIDKAFNCRAHRRISHAIERMRNIKYLKPSYRYNYLL
jgi:cystathionine beta-synthase